MPALRRAVRRRLEVRECQRHIAAQSVTAKGWSYGHLGLLAIRRPGVTSIPSRILALPAADEASFGTTRRMSTED